MGTTKVELKGGPNSHDVELWIGGQKQNGVRRVDLVADVGDLIRITTYQYAEVVASVEGIVQPVWTTKVNFHGDEGWKVLAHSSADTLWQALADCSKQLELGARREAMDAET